MSGPYFRKGDRVVSIVPYRYGMEGEVVELDPEEDVVFVAISGPDGIVDCLFDENELDLVETD